MFSIVIVLTDSNSDVYVGEGSGLLNSIPDTSAVVMSNPIDIIPSFPLFLDIISD